MQSPLKLIEPRLRRLLPADLYAAAWLDSRYADADSPEQRQHAAQILRSVSDHLRTMQHILYDYVPRDVARRQPQPGELHHEWQQGVLMFTDLSGFTRLMEAEGVEEGAARLHRIMSSYFARMIHIVGESGGTLLQFTGDAMLIRFRSYQKKLDVGQAVRAAVRMQRAMSGLDAPLTMRIGIHVGHYLDMDVGTPLRMDQVLLGEHVLLTKKAESAGVVERICLTDVAYQQVSDQFRFEPTPNGYWLLIDDLSDRDLGQFDLPSLQHRLPRVASLDFDLTTLINNIEALLDIVERLAAYLPASVLRLLVENVESASKLKIPPDFAPVTLLFVNLLGLSEAADQVQPGEEHLLADWFSRVFARMNAAVESRGGVLKKVTYNAGGSDVMIFFGVPSGHTDDPARAAGAALAIREIIRHSSAPLLGGKAVRLGCQMGMAAGKVFAAEIGALRSRREYNVLGDVVNTAARLSVRADLDQILMTEAVYQSIAGHYVCNELGEVMLKGKTTPSRLYELVSAAAMPSQPDDLTDLLGSLNR